MVEKQEQNLETIGTEKIMMILENKDKNLAVGGRQHKTVTGDFSEVMVPENYSEPKTTTPTHSPMNTYIRQYKKTPLLPKRNPDVET